MPTPAQAEELQGQVAALLSCTKACIRTLRAELQLAHELEALLEPLVHTPANAEPEEAERNGYASTRASGGAAAA